MNLTIQSVNQNPRLYPTKFGDMASFGVTFTDGTRAEVTCKSENRDRTLERLNGLVGTAAEYVLQDQGYFESGDAKPQKVTDYPGKPGGTIPGSESNGERRSAPGGGSGSHARNSRSEPFKADPFKQALIVAENALNNAVALACAGRIEFAQIEEVTRSFAATSYALAGELQDSGDGEAKGKGNPVTGANGTAGGSSWPAVEPGGVSEGAPDANPPGPSLEGLWSTAAELYGTEGAVVRAAHDKFGTASKADVTDEHLLELVSAKEG